MKLSPLVATMFLLRSRQRLPATRTLWSFLLGAGTLGQVQACDRDDPPPTGPRVVVPSTPQAVVVGATVMVLPIVADALNDLGQATGSRYLWTPDQGVQDIGTLGGVSSVANAINNLGQVAGTSFTPGNAASHAFLWTPGHGMQDLGTLGGKESYGRGINDRGQVVGESNTMSGAMHAFLWTPERGMQDLGTLDGSLPFSRANAVNNLGIVVGESYRPTGPIEHSARATMWMPGGSPHYLGTLGGQVSLAYDINDAGQIVGESRSALGSTHAFLWTRGKGMRDLGTLGGVESRALAVNAAGYVAGQSQTEDGFFSAFLWTAADGMEDLRPLTGMLSASAINNRQQVLVGNRLATLYLATDQDAERAFMTGSGFFRVGGPERRKAHFAFEAKFLPDRPVPNGMAKFWIPGAQIDFESSAIEMLVVAENSGQFWGAGMLNGLPARFRITIVDGQRASERVTGAVDAFRIELWRAGTLVFDTQPGEPSDAPVTMPIEGGAIHIHWK